MASPIAEAVIRPKERLNLINAAMEHDLARRKERDHGYEDVVEVCFTCNNTSLGVDLFNAEPLPTPYVTVPSTPLETNFSEFRIIRWCGRQGQEARTPLLSSVSTLSSWRRYA